MQAADDLIERKRPHPRSGQFDGQRHAVETAADLGDRFSVVVCDGEIGPGAASAVGEQLDSLVGKRQRGHLPIHLAGNQKWFAARRQNRHPRAAGKHFVDQFGAGLQQMLAVVQHHQQPTVADRAQQRLGDRATRLVRQPERASHRERHHLWMRDRRQIGIENAVGEVTAHLAGDLDRQPRLACAACAGQGHEPVVGQGAADLGDLCCAADEARQLRREIMRGNGIRCPQRWEVVAQIGMAQLRYPDGTGEVAQPVAAQIGQPRLVGKLVFDHLLGCGRNDGLAAVCQVAQPRGLVDRRARVVALVAQLHVAGVNPDTKLDRGEIGPLQAPARISPRRRRARTRRRSCRPHPARPGVPRRARR